jgi:N-acetylglucosamine kinase-like BadF-type ATPase
MEAGINIVAGTGSICYGVNQEGIAARASGWGAYCDEGSRTWLGAKTIAIYAKQADGRLPRTQIYQLFREHFAIEEDLMFIHRLNHEVANKGSETAKIQMLLKKAYEFGDVNAAKLYREAAKELTLSIHAVAKKLGMSDSSFNVSYSGGLFKSGDCILLPLAKEVEHIGGQLVKPRFSPEEGAILFAMKSYQKDMDLTKIVFRN